MASPRLAAADQLLKFLSGHDPEQATRQQESVAPLTRELTLGCYRQLSVLDWTIKQLATRKPDLATRAFLLPAIYEILFLDGTPDHAVVHQGMEDAKQRLKAGQLKFLNAILRRCCRERDALLQQIEHLPPKIRRCHPSVLVEQWKRFYSSSEIDAICTWNNQRAAVSLRIVPHITTVAEYLAQLEQAEVAAQPHPSYPEMFVEVSHPGSISKLPGYHDGAFYVQDPSTIHATALLDAQPGERILDVCAAPGGKTLLLAEAMQGVGELLAIDKQAGRIKLLKENLTRMNQAWVKTMTRDAHALHDIAQADAAKFDGILLDVPCSNTGVLRRRPEARWRYNAAAIKQLNILQTGLLDATIELLKPGGRLVYSTCSIEPHENERLVETWISQRSSGSLGKTHRILPGERQSDGSFAARIDL